MSRNSSFVVEVGERRVFCSLLRRTAPLIILAGVFQTLPAQGRVPRRPPQSADDLLRLLPAKADTSEMVLVGKAYCSLTRTVALPFEGVITSGAVGPGRRVEKGAVLARYRLSRKSTQTVRRKLERVELAQGDLEEESALLSAELGASVTPGRVPEYGVLTSPISGHVIWVSSELREGAELPPDVDLFRIGVMDRMLIRTLVFEQEAIRLAEGDNMTVYAGPFLQRKMTASVSRISWSPVSLGEPAQPSYYEVELVTDNPGLLLREGMRVVLNIFKPVKGAEDQSDGKPPSSQGPGQPPRP